MNLPPGPSSSRNSGPLYYKCPLCPFILEDLDMLNDHISSNHSEETEQVAGASAEPIFYQCPMCPITSDDFQFIYNHVASNHPEDTSAETVVSDDDEVEEKAAATGDAQDEEAFTMNLKTQSGSKVKVAVPLIKDKVNYENEKVDFYFLILNACVLTARDNAHQLYSGKSVPKWNKNHVIEWLNDKVPESIDWSPRLVKQRILDAEKYAKQFSMNKTESFRTGMGSFDCINDSEKMPDRDITTRYQEPQNDQESELGKMYSELERLRKDINETNQKKMKSSRQDKAMDFHKSMESEDKAKGGNNEGMDDMDEKEQVNHEPDRKVQIFSNK